MLTDLKMQKLLENLKSYHKRFLNGTITELDESGTRIMINHFLTDVLGFTALEEVRTEYMIKGTYADYMIQINGKRHFLVEVKAFSLNLNESHLRQAINYGANEGVEWALLTNGKSIDFYKILFEKPISHKKVFSIDLTDLNGLKNCLDFIQYLTKDCVVKNGLDVLWNKSLALTPVSVSKIILGLDIITSIRKEVNKQFETKFTNDQIQNTVLTIISEKVDITGLKLPKVTLSVVKKSPVIKEKNIIEQTNQNDII